MKRLSAIAASALGIVLVLAPVVRGQCLSLPCRTSNSLACGDSSAVYNQSSFAIDRTDKFPGYFRSSSSVNNTVALYGYYLNCAGVNPSFATGVLGESWSNNQGCGVRGTASATSGTTYGVRGQSKSPSGAGVYGFNSSGGVGVLAESSGTALQVAGTSTFSGTASLSGSPAFTVGSASLISNLNADLLDGQTGSYYQNASNLTGTLPDARLSTNVALLNAAQTFSAGKTFSAVPSFTAAGSPFSVTGTGLVTNLNADLLDGLHASAFMQSIPVPLTLSGTSATHIIRGENASNVDGASGVYGLCTAASGATYGVYGKTASTTGTGVFGEATATSDVNYGVRGTTANPLGYAIYGKSLAANSLVAAIYGENAVTNGYGTGVKGVGLSTGVSGRVDGTANNQSYYDMLGWASCPDANNTSAVGVKGRADGGNDKTGVYGEALGVGENYGVYGTATGGTTNWAGYFQGNVNILGTLSKAGGSFKIDHPLDPENKYLYHSFVESPDMMNIYNGNIVTDEYGYADVTLPEWFEALNRDFRYQLTILDDSNTDEFVQAKVVRKIEGNAFTIRTSRPRVEVSWQVTGIRQDPFANAHRIPIEQEKPDAERGLYAHPTEWGQPESKGIDWEHQERMRRQEATRRPSSATPQSDQPSESPN